VKKFGITLIALGLLLISIFIFADLLGFGRDGGIGAAQILGIQVAIIVVLVGLSLIFIGQKEKINLINISQSALTWLLNLPTIVWVCIGFLLVYLMLFVSPMFLNPEHRLQYFNRYIPDHAPIGLDLNTIVASIDAWLSTHESPYPDFFYPPLHHVLVAPITLLDYPQSYYLVTMLTLFSYFILSFLIPLSASRSRDYSIAVFFFVTSFFSYGFQFELERGQFNVIAFTLCILAIYLFYFRKSFRLLSYVIFSVSIHLRIYPAIFIVMFVDDWSVWKQNLKRLFGIGILNLILLFALGYPLLIEFFQSLTTRMGATWTWIGNHSIASFVYNLVNSGFGLFDQDTLLWFREHSTFITVALLLYFATCFIAVILKDFVNKERGLNPDLLLICTIGGLIIPSVSHDYKLALLAGPLAIFLSNRKIPPANWKKMLSALLITLSSLAFSITLFPFKYRPEYLENSFIPLLVILTSVTLMSFLNGPKYLGVDLFEETKY
jgi:hypothetical protein